MKVIIKTAHKRIVAVVKSLIGAKNVAARRLYGDDCVITSESGQVLTAKVNGRWENGAKVVEVTAGASYQPLTNDVVLVVGDLSKFVSTWTSLWNQGFQRIIF